MIWTVLTQVAHVWKVLQKVFSASEHGILTGWQTVWKLQLGINPARNFLK